MVLDPLRTRALDRAIHKVVRRGDVVCDIGAGLGLLSYFAISAGAKFAYAIDCDTESLNYAAQHARKNGIFDRIAFIAGHSADVTLPEKVDVIICEVIGSAAFDENILATLIDAKRRFLKDGGKMIPSVIELWGAPATFAARSGKGNMIETAHVAKKDLLCAPKLLARIETTKKFGPAIHIKENFVINKDGKLSGVAVWPKIEWAKGLSTDASPLKPLTHWKQCALPDVKRQVKRGDEVKFELIIGPDPSAPRESTEVLWRSQVI